MSCFGGAEEQLYLLELLVERLKLPADKFKDVACGDGGSDCALIAKIKFLDFPTFEISQRDFYFSKAPTPRDAKGCLDFSAGRACLFIKQPRDLVKAMQRTPLKIGIFCAGDTYPLARTEIELSGCLCNQIAMAANDPAHLPPPYTLKGGYHLLDPGDNPSGTINLDVRLSCLGKSWTTHYQHDQQSFFFKNDRDDDRYCVKRILPVALSEAAGKDSAFPTGVAPDEKLEQVPVDPKPSEDGRPDDENRPEKKKNGTKKKKSKK